MSFERLTRKSLRPRSTLSLSAEITFALGRVHELTGPSRVTLALMIASGLKGPVLWIRRRWQGERLNADGIRNYLNPGRFLFVDADRPEDMLWSMEEALRSGAVPLVVADLSNPPGLTPVRRLNLAAEVPDHPPLGLLLTSGETGARGVESRWSMTPAPAWVSDKPATWTLTRTHARVKPPQDWAVQWGRNGFRLDDPPTSGVLRSAV